MTFSDLHQGEAGAIPAGKAPAERRAFSASAFKNLAGRLKQANVPAVDVPSAHIAPPAPLAAASVQPSPAPVFDLPPVAVLPPPRDEQLHEPPPEAVFGAKAEAQAADEAARRLIELELETIWRMMLATPTAEDLELYLREAAEIMADDPLYAEPPPEELTPETEVSPYDDEAGEMVRSFGPDDEAIIASASERARTLLDMMASGTGLPHERSLAADTLLRLVSRLDITTLRLLAKRLSMMDSPPPLLISRLLRDQRVEVVGPLLEDCNHILDRDLKAVIEQADSQKLKLIARRRNLGAAISDEVLATGDVLAILHLLRNDDANISPAGYLHALAAALDAPELLVPMLNRRDLSAALAFEAFWIAPAEQRRLIISRYLTDSEALARILRITLSLSDKAQGADTGSSREHVMLEALERAVRGNQHQAADEVSAALGVAPKTVMRVFMDEGGEALAVLLRAAGYPRNSVTGLLQRMREPTSSFTKHLRSIEELQSLYETLSLNKARILLTYWDWAQNMKGPYAQPK